MIAAVLRPASRRSGKQIVGWLHRLITAIRGHWPRVEIMLRANSHYRTPEVLRFCRAREMDYTLDVAPTSTLRKHVLSLKESTAARAATAADDTKLHRFKEFYDGAASWDCQSALNSFQGLECAPLGGQNGRFELTQGLFNAFVLAV